MSNIKQEPTAKGREGQVVANTLGRGQLLLKVEPGNWSIAPLPIAQLPIADTIFREIEK